jgi:rhodanese-related sulfurtransferase
MRSGDDTTTVAALLAAAQEEIRRYTPMEAIAAARAGAVLVDIRPIEQRRRDGAVPGAVLIDRNVLEWRLDPASPYRLPELARRDREVILICDEGYQSSLAAVTLRGFGLDAGDVIDGVQGWIAAGQELEFGPLQEDGPSVPAEISRP